MTFSITNANDLAKEVARHEQNALMEQLNDFISRGLIVIERGEQQFFTDAENPNKINIATTVKLVLKDKEYIEKLEKEVTELKSTVWHLGKAMKVYEENN